MWETNNRNETEIIKCGRRISQGNNNFWPTDEFLYKKLFNAKFKLDFFSAMKQNLKMINWRTKFENVNNCFVLIDDGDGSFRCGRLWWKFSRAC